MKSAELKDIVDTEFISWKIYIVYRHQIVFNDSAFVCELNYSCLSISHSSTINFNYTFIQVCVMKRYLNLTSPQICHELPCHVVTVDLICILGLATGIHTRRSLVLAWVLQSYRGTLTDPFTESVLTVRSIILSLRLIVLLEGMVFHWINMRQIDR